MKKKICIVGAGLSGSIIAHELAKKGFSIEIYDKRGHVGGNCFTERDDDTGIMKHVYGPHIFHTDNIVVWNYINSFIEMVPFTNKVKCLHNGRIYSLPINLHTINQFYGKSFSPKEAKEFLETRTKNLTDIVSFEDQALAFIGEDLYRAFFEGYTAKQWGRSPKELPASILKRLPVRFNYDDNYFFHNFQGIPKDGYTPFFDKLLSHSNIRLYLNSNVIKDEIVNSYDFIFWSGPLDEYFDYKFGKLEYRTLDFVEERYGGDFQGCAVMNYCDIDAPYTRITEHKYFEPWNLSSTNQTIVFKEYSRECGESDIPYYPVRLAKDKDILSMYQVEKDLISSKVQFIGRLGTYSYLDMDVCIANALEIAEKFISQNR